MSATGSLSATEVEFGNAVPAAHCLPPKLSARAEAAEAWSPGSGSGKTPAFLTLGDQHSANNLEPLSSQLEITK